MTLFHPRLEILPAEQREAWRWLGFTKESFVLYGGTALALRLGHRVSVDFDFFSFAPLDPGALLRRQPWGSSAEPLQLEPNTLTVLIRQGDRPVRLSFFGGISWKPVQEAEMTDDGMCRVAGLPDLFATKLNTVYQRAEAKDYLDIHALLQSGLSLSQGLDFARQVYGSEFNAMLPVQALCYFEEPRLQALPVEVKADLVAAVRTVT